jgi:uncharacterized protein YjbI with pentapeptide repeats
VDVVLEVGVMTAEELLERYAAGERNFAGVDLTPSDGDWIKLTRQNLQGINLRGAYLYRANFGLSDLTGADLSGAYLKSAALGCAILKNARLRGAVLTLSILRMTDLSHSDLTDANLIGARLMEANLTKVDLSEALLIDADMTGAIGEYKSMNIYSTLFWNTILPDGRTQIEPVYDVIWASPIESP